MGVHQLLKSKRRNSYSAMVTRGYLHFIKNFLGDFLLTCEGYTGWAHCKLKKKMKERKKKA